jgi:hypothetical protein
MGAAWRSLAVVQRMASRVATRGLNATGLAKTVRAERSRRRTRGARAPGRTSDAARGLAPHPHSLTYSLTPVRIPPFALAQLSETASSRWYLLIECLPHVFGSIALRFVLADVLGLEIFAMDVVSGFANSAIFVSE